MQLEKLLEQEDLKEFMERVKSKKKNGNGQMKEDYKEVEKEPVEMIKPRSMM